MLLGLMFAVPAARAQAQSAVITGKVMTEFNQPIEGANVYITELTVSVATNAQGAYSITIPAARVSGQQVTLRVRSFGFVPQTKPITVRAGSQTADFSLKQDVNRLDEVVVTGVTAGTEQKKLPFTVAHVDESQMPVPASNPLSQIQGKVAGINIMSTQGRPGTTPSVVIRGPKSINASGRSQEPLYIVDGIVTSSLPDLNPLDIESIEVVKGAAAASLYGSRAGNGVMQITTKSGKSGSEGIKFNARAEYGQNDIEKQYLYAKAHGLMMDPTGQRFCLANAAATCTITMSLADEALRVNQDGGDFSLAPAKFQNDIGIAAAPTYNALREQFLSNRFPVSYDPIAAAVLPGAWTNSSIDATGHVGQTNFFASANNFKQDGAIRFVPGYLRNSLRLNVDQNVGTDWSFGLRTFYSTSSGNTEQGSGFFHLTRVPAGIDLLRTDNQGRMFVRSNPLNQGDQNANPLYEFASRTNRDNRERFQAAFQSRYQPFSWGEVSTNISFDRLTARNFNQADRGTRTTSSAPTTNLGNVGASSNANSAYNGDVTATARQTFFSDFTGRTTLRYIYEQADNTSIGASGSSLATPGLQTLNAVYDQNSLGISSGLSSVRSIGMMASEDFEYKGRYILGVLGRRDGSSLFGAQNRWANYGRGSLAWRVSDEPWWFLPRALNELKLRGSVGTAGNRPSFSAQYETFGIGNGGSLTASTFGNKNLRPEHLTETEIGADMEAFSKYGITVNYSKTIADDQLLQVPPSRATGYTTQWQNAGTMESTTWEAQVNIPIITRRNMNWSMRMNYDRNRAVITRLDLPAYTDGPNQQGATAMFKVAQGEVYGSFYGRAFAKSCSDLPGYAASQCGGAGSVYQKNSDGFIVYVGAGNTLGDGVTKNLWAAGIPGCINSTTKAVISATGELACKAAGGTVFAPWGKTISWGMPILLADSTGTAQQRKLGNALPDFSLSMQHTFNYKRLFAYGLFQGVHGRKVFNEGLAWSLGDFMNGVEDQLGKSVQDARPIGYYWRTSESVGVGGFYDALGPNNYNVESGDFIKLRELNLSYSVGPVRGVGDWTISLIGRNLKTWTDYRGFDPEVGLGGGNAGSALINAVDAYNYPNTRSFTLSLGTRF